MNNVNPEEIAKFDALATTWWDPNGEMKPLHQLNPLRLSFIEQHISLKDKNVIDIGCGGGLLSEAMCKQGAKVTAIDLSKQVLKVATQHAKKQGLDIQYECIPAEQMADAKPHQFDVVTCMELLEHVPDPKALIQTCSQLVKPGGLVFFSTLNRSVKSFLMAIVGAEYILNMLPRGTHDYAQFIRPSELNNWARHAKLSLTKIQGLHYQPLSGNFSLSTNLSVNYLACYEYQTQQD